MHDQASSLLPLEGTKMTTNLQAADSTLSSNTQIEAMKNSKADSAAVDADALPPSGQQHETNTNCNRPCTIDVLVAFAAMRTNPRKITVHSVPVDQMIELSEGSTESNYFVELFELRLFRDHSLFIELDYCPFGYQM
jgi:hypothetical protein